MQYTVMKSDKRKQSFETIVNRSTAEGAFDDVYPDAEVYVVEKSSIPTLLHLGARGM